MAWSHFLIAGLMIVAGLTGGLANHLSQEPSSDTEGPVRVGLPANLIVSLVAAFVTPLFLSLAKSTLLDVVLADLGTQKPLSGDIFVFFGFCLVAAFSARVFVHNLTDTVLNLSRSQQKLSTRVGDVEKDVAEVSSEVEPPVTQADTASLSPPLPLQGRLSPNQKHMLEALVSRPFTWRSVAGIRKEVGLGRETATGVLENLVQAQLADGKASKAGGTLYRITAGGRAALGMAPLVDPGRTAEASPP